MCGSSAPPCQSQLSHLIFSSARMQVAYWSIFFSLFFISTITSKRTSPCNLHPNFKYHNHVQVLQPPCKFVLGTQPGGCFRQRALHGASGQVGLGPKSKPKQIRHHRKPAHFSRSSTHHNNKTRSTDTKQSFYEKYSKAAESLSKDMIVALMLKERSIGLYLNEYRDSITKGLSRLESLTKAWATQALSVEYFLYNMSLTLDDLKLGSEAIKDDMVRLYKLVTEPSNSSTSVRRSHYKSKHIDDANTARDLRQGLDSGRYLFSDLGNEANMFVKLSESSRDLCSKGTSNETSKSNCNSERASEKDWWTPITGVREHLKYANLWMIFMEEVNSKLESIEFQIQSKKKSPGEFGIWFENNNITSKNAMEALDLMVKEYNLYSIRANIAEMAATATDIRLEYLNEMLRIFLKVKPKCSIKNNVAHVAAIYLLMSQVINCTRTLTMINSNISSIAVLASARFYIDDDFMASSIRSPQLELGMIIQMVVLAPEWTVVGGYMRNIDLTGRKPADYKNLSKTEGEPGLPGEQGGSFTAFINSVSAGNLTIILNGGNGGNGQSGSISEFCIMGCFEEEVIPDDKEYCCDGKKVSQFIRGIDGGQKGKGGLPGDYQTFLFANGTTQNRITFKQNLGAEGEEGKGGKFYTVQDGFTCSGDSNAESGIFIRDNPFRYCHDKTKPEIHVVKPLTAEKRDKLNGHAGNSTIKPMEPTKIPFEPQISVRATLKYKNLTKKHLHLFNAPKIYNFISNVDFNDTSRNFHTPIDLIQEFNNLGKEPLEGNLNRELLKLSFQSLAVRAEALAQNSNADKDQVKLLLFLSAAARSKMLAVSYPFEPIFVANMKDFLTLEKTRISELKAATEEQLQFEYLRKIVSDYNTNIQKRFQDGASYTNSTVNPELGSIQIQLGKFTKDLLGLIRRSKQDMDDEALRAHRKTFESHRTGNLVWDVFKTIANAINVLFPIGDAINAGVDFVNSIYNPNSNKPPVMPVMIPQTVASGCSSAALRFRNSTSYTIQGFKRQVAAVESTLKAHAQVFPNALKVLEGIKASQDFQDGNDSAVPIDSFPPADCILSYKRLITIETLIKEAQGNVSSAIKLDESNADPEALKPAAEAIEIALAVIQGTASTFNQWEQDKGNIEEVAKAIQTTEGRSRVLVNQTIRIETEILGEMNSLFQSLSDQRQDLHGKFSVALLVIRHRMESSVRDIQIVFRQGLVKGTDLEVYFERVLKSLEDAVDTLTTIYERIDAYQQQSKLTNFTAQVAQNPEQYLGKLTDETLQKKFDVLKFTFQGQVLLKRQSLVEGAFRMWNFPIVEPALCDFKNLSASSLDFSTLDNVKKLLAAIEIRLVNLIEIVNMGTGNIGAGAKYIIKAEFIHKEQDKGYPFYKWANSSFNQFITSVLAGVPTFLHSEHMPGPPTCEAIKVTRLILAFGSVFGNLGEERELQELLNKYALSLTHVGNSFYLFANQTFVIPGEKIEFYFSFDIGEDGLPRVHNQAYDKLLSGDITISPYSTWGIQIQPIDSNQGFEPLAKYVDKFDLYLDGYGICVRKSFAVEGDYVSPTCEVIK